VLLGFAAALDPGVPVGRGCGAAFAGEAAMHAPNTTAAVAINPAMIRRRRNKGVRRIDSSYIGRGSNKPLLLDNVVNCSEATPKP
jgi:hypothetical protein